MFCKPYYHNIYFGHILIRKIGKGIETSNSDDKVSSIALNRRCGIIL